MGTVISRIEVNHAGWRGRHSALHLAVTAAKNCLRESHRDPHDVDLLVNAGIYRDRNLGEPALAALIQDDISANPESPHDGAHGTFSFDITNGTCGVLTALQIVDGFLKSHAIDCALVVASDADPGRGMSERFPVSLFGAAVLCGWVDGDAGLGPVRWTSLPDDGENFSATVGLVDSRNVLRFSESTAMDQRYADAAARAADECLREASLELIDIDTIFAAPARRRYRAALAAHLGVPVERIVVAPDEKMHTAALAAALDQAADRVSEGGRVLLIAAGAGVTAGAAVYRKPSLSTHRCDQDPR
jgi:3-oxoacyl-[acyl-carrier-protein] synthase-3